MIRDIHRVYRNEKIKAFLESLPESEQEAACKMLHFIKTEFPECNEQLRGKLIHEEITNGRNTSSSR